MSQDQDQFGLQSKTLDVLLNRMQAAASSEHLGPNSYIAALLLEAASRLQSNQSASTKDSTGSTLVNHSHKLTKITPELRPKLIGQKCILANRAAGVSIISVLRDCDTYFDYFASLPVFED